jgi:OFA family oxalate/formate antiporter-like MFS transporter
VNKTKSNVSMAVAGTLAFLFMGILYAWSIFRVELEKLFDFSAAQMSLTFSIAITFFCLGGFLGGKLTQRRNPALVMRIASVLVLLGFCTVPLMARFEGSQALRVLYISYGAVAGLGVGMGYNVGLGNVGPWFPTHIGLVTGIMLMGFGCAGIVFSLVMDVLCPVVGVFGVLRIFGVAMFVVMLGSSFFVRRPPTAAGGTDDNTQSEETDIVSYTPRQMVSSGSFWVYFLWNVLNGASGLLVINSAANIAVYFGAAASVGMIISLFNGGCRPVIGHVCDKVDRFTGMLLMNAMILASAVLLIITAYTGSTATMVCGLVIMGVAYGGGSTMGAKVINALYGPKYYAVNHSISNFCIIASSFVGPYISGHVQDRSGGGYTATFFMLLCMGLVQVALIFVLKKVISRETEKMRGE